MQQLGVCLLLPQNAISSSYNLGQFQFFLFHAYDFLIPLTHYFFMRSPYACGYLGLGLIEHSVDFLFGIAFQGETIIAFVGVFYKMFTHPAHIVGRECAV